MFAKIRLVAAAVVTGALVAVTGGCGILSPSPAETCMYPQVGAVAEVGDGDIVAADFRGDCVTVVDAARTATLEAEYIEAVRLSVAGFGRAGAEDAQVLLCQMLEDPEFKPTSGQLDKLQERFEELFAGYNLADVEAPSAQNC